MTTTLVSSASREVKIGFDQPFCVIGERINPTGRKILNEELERGDFSRVEADALAEVLEAEEQKRLAFDDLPGSDTLSDAAIAELNVLLGIDPTVASDAYVFGDAMRPSQ